MKIDTDGGDFDVLQNGIQSISKYMPMLLFECDVFGNNNYFIEFMNVLKSLTKIGYTKILVYNNFGYLFNSISLEDLSEFKDLIFLSND